MAMNTTKVNISLEVEAVIINTSGDHKYLVATPYGTVQTEENGVRQLVWNPAHPGHHDYMIIYADNPTQARDKYKELNTESEWCSVIEELPYQRHRLTISLIDVGEFGELKRMLHDGFHGTLSYGFMSPDEEKLDDLIDVITGSYLSGFTQHDDDRERNRRWEPVTRMERRGGVLLITSNEEKYKRNPVNYVESYHDIIHNPLGKCVNVIQMESIDTIKIEMCIDTYIDFNHTNIDGVIFDYTFKDEEYVKIQETYGLMRNLNIPIIMMNCISDAGDVSDNIDDIWQYVLTDNTRLNFIEILDKLIMIDFDGNYHLKKDRPIQ